MSTGPITSLMATLPKPMPQGPSSAQGEGPRQGQRPGSPVRPERRREAPESKGDGARRLAEILTVCERIYNRDRKRFAKLIVWVHSARKRKYEDRYILHALTILDKREAEGKPIADWWPWCDRAISYIRTRDKQGESQHYKKADFSSARAIMKELFKNL